MELVENRNLLDMFVCQCGAVLEEKVGEEFFGRALDNARGTGVGYWRSFLEECELL
jgi:hypothetical protein|tara:strand:- start:69 stop:236 length:168 start_codon:yes stop_codon:yes gene_type:complete